MFPSLRPSSYPSICQLIYPSANYLSVHRNIQMSVDSSAHPFTLVSQYINPQFCCSNIWCQGPLLESIQNAKLFTDSKTYVDMNLKTEPGKLDLYCILKICSTLKFTNSLFCSMNYEINNDNAYVVKMSKSSNHRYK